MNEPVRSLLFTISSHSLYQGIVKNKIFKFLLYNGRVTYKYFVKLGRVYLLLVSKLLLCNVMLWKGHSRSLIMPLFLYIIKGWFTDPWVGASVNEGTTMFIAVYWKLSMPHFCIVVDYWKSTIYINLACCRLIQILSHFDCWCLSTLKNVLYILFWLL